VGDVVELAPAVEADEAAVGELELDPASFVAPDPIAWQKRQVGRGLLGTRLRCPLQRDALVEVADAAVAKIVLICGGR
jgi:hypothetical protein